MKKIVSCFIMLVMMLALVACGEKAPQTVTLKLGHGQTEAHPYHTGAVKFKELVEKYTEGRVQIEIHLNGTMGSEREMVEGCQTGTVDLCLTTNAPLTNFDANFNIYEFPYLFTSREEAHKIMDGEFGQNLLDGLSAVGIKGLSYFENGFRNVTNDEKPIVKPEDLAGLKIRTMESTIHIDSFKALGANPTPMSWGEVYTSISQKTINGQENPPMAIVDGKIYEVNQYFSKTEHFYSPCELVMSLNKFNQLSEADQKAVLKAAKEAAVYQREVAGAYNEEKIDFLIENGMKVNEVDKQLFVDATASVYEKYQEEYGDVIAQVLALLGR